MTIPVAIEGEIPVELALNLYVIRRVQVEVNPAWIQKWLGSKLAFMISVVLSNLKSFTFVPIKPEDTCCERAERPVSS